MATTCPACGSPLPPLPGVPEPRMIEVAAAIKRNNLIAAIKFVRELSHLGLKDSKDYVECPHLIGPAALAPLMPPNPRRSPMTCVVIGIALLLILGGALAWLAVVFAQGVSRKLP